MIDRQAERWLNVDDENSHSRSFLEQCRQNAGMLDLGSINLSERIRKDSRESFKRKAPRKTRASRSLGVDVRSNPKRDACLASLRPSFVLPSSPLILRDAKGKHAGCRKERSIKVKRATQGRVEWAGENYRQRRLKDTCRYWFAGVYREEIRHQAGAGVENQAAPKLEAS